jgi:hypothetical protein
MGRVSFALFAPFAPLVAGRGCLPLDHRRGCFPVLLHFRDRRQGQVDVYSRAPAAPVVAERLAEVLAESDPPFGAALKTLEKKSIASNPFR